MSKVAIRLEGNARLLASLQAIWRTDPISYSYFNPYPPLNLSDLEG